MFRHISSQFCLSFICLAFLVAGYTASFAQGTSISLPEIIYDNSGEEITDPQDPQSPPQFYPRSEEYGDEVYLKAASDGSSWRMTEFIFEYFGDFTPQGDEMVRFRIYKNDGEGKFPAPNTLVFDSELLSSGGIPLEAGYQTKRFVGLDIPVPASFTWTVQFSGLRNVKGDSAGLILWPKPGVGRSFKDFWIKTPTGWRLATIPPPNPNLPADPVTNPDQIENFGSRIYGLPATLSAPPGIRIQPDGEFVSIEWFRGGRLQVADSITGPFVDVAEAKTPFRAKIEPGTIKFWREAAGPAATP